MVEIRASVVWVLIPLVIMCYSFGYAKCMQDHTKNIDDQLLYAEDQLNHTTDFSVLNDGLTLKQFKTLYFNNPEIVRPIMRYKIVELCGFRNRTR